MKDDLGVLRLDFIRVFVDLLVLIKTLGFITFLFLPTKQKYTVVEGLMRAKPRC